MFKSIFLALGLLLASASAAPAFQPARSVLVSEEVCTAPEVTVAELKEAIAKAGYSAGSTVALKGAAYDSFKKVLSTFAPPPPETDSFLVVNLGDRVLISAMRGHCSLGSLVIPQELFERLVLEAAGQRSNFRPVDGLPTSSDRA